ncbi:MAG: hypothetical protein HWE24_04685 [Oceanospirillaceae bacterium]|nr:hypothetical protein [Oceanospirillaceae bacterium]
MHNQIINSLYEEFLEGLADLNQIKQIVNRAFQREFTTLENSNNPTKANDIVTQEAYAFDNPFTGKLEKYAFRDTTIETLKQLTFWHKNSQYCWLLMSAYEKFESFIKSVYKELTGENPRDFNKILSRLSDAFQSIKDAESKNDFNINLRVAVLLVERMRHAIAHNQGIIDPPQFIKKVINASGIGNNKEEHKEFISQFIFKNKICILELPVDDNSRLNRTHDLYRVLVSYLISYAYLVNNAIE